MRYAFRAMRWKRSEKAESAPQGPSMEVRYTRHQVARGARADAESPTQLFLFKKVSRLRATYQVRLLLFQAMTTGRTLVIVLPRGGQVDRTLKELSKRAPKHLVIERRG